MLIQSLLANPASVFHAAVAGWSHPITREGMTALNTFDLLLMRWSEKDKFKASPRPWDRKPKRGRRMSSAEAHKRLRPHLYKT